MTRFRRTVLLAFGIVVGGAATASAQTDKMIVWIDADGSTYLKNNSATETYKIDGYSIMSENNDLIFQDYDGVKGWRAIEDIATQFPELIVPMTTQLGAAALTMGSANPGPGNLTEVTLNVAGLEFSPGETWFIGKPFTMRPCDSNGGAGYAFYFKTTNDTQQQGLGFCIAPEPSSWLLAILSSVGLLAVRRRAPRSGREK